MKKLIVLTLAAAASALILAGCDDSAETKKAPAPEAVKAEASSAAEKKPAGVPTSTYNKVKSIESQHNSDVEKALKD